MLASINPFCFHSSFISLKQEYGSVLTEFRGSRKSRKNYVREVDTDFFAYASVLSTPTSQNRLSES